tara:strand:- start:6151 stop:6774 length:624 start_codon:yes stop_codon:yes gene_type:complete
MVNSSFITDSELNGYISASYAELYDLLVQSGLIYFTPGTHTITASGSETYALPSDYYGTVRVDRLSGSDYIPLVEYMITERTSYENNGGSNSIGYSVQGANISLLPAPSAGTYRHIYIPAPVDLTASADSTTIDGVSGWEEFIVVDAARKMLQKEESSTVAVERDIARLRVRIEEMAQNRAWATPRRVVDVQGDRFDAIDWWRTTSV